jgi:ankyrin repeat protein
VLNSKDTLGQNLLHIAVDGMNYSAVKSLEDLELAEKLINSTDNFLMTPMHMAAMNFDVEIFLLLCKLKPNLELKDSEKKTCIDYLKENDDIDKSILDLIEDVKF